MPVDSTQVSDSQADGDYVIFTQPPDTSSQEPADVDYSIFSDVPKSPSDEAEEQKPSRTEEPKGAGKKKPKKKKAQKRESVGISDLDDALRGLAQHETRAPRIKRPKHRPRRQE